MKNIFKITTVIALLFFIINGCTKEDFDETPEYITDWTANTSIADLKAKYSTVPAKIDTNIIIKGIVISSDKEGNFYKELFIQDETGAISIRLDNGYLYTKYPVGRLVYINCQGLYIGTYNEVYQLGLGANIDRINSALIEDYIDISAGGTPVTPATLTIDKLADSLIGTFIRLENVEFSNFNTTYADNNVSYTTRNISDCSGNTVVMSTSSYADFAKDSLPQGNGTIDAVLSKFQGAYQLRINTTDDVNLTGSRCTK